MISDNSQCPPQNQPNRTGSALGNRSNYPGSSVCERCNENVKPVLDTYPGLVTHLIALLLLCIGLPFLIFLPYCFDCFGKPVHRCPKCGSFIDKPPMQPPRPPLSQTALPSTTQTQVQPQANPQTQAPPAV